MVEAVDPLQPLLLGRSELLSLEEMNRIAREQVDEKEKEGEDQQQDAGCRPGHRASSTRATNR